MKEAKKDLIADIKNGIIIAAIFFMIFLLLEIILAGNQRLIVFINHGIYLPKPEIMTSIYQYTYQDGEDLNIWRYNEKNFNKVLSKKKFYQINDSNIKKIEEKVIDYYNGLDENETKLFNKNVDIEKIVSLNNYYFYKESKKDNQTFLIIIADCASKKLYFFNKAN